MTLFQIAAFYIALNLLLVPILMIRVGRIRLAKKVSLGDGGDTLLLSRIRAHANFIETTPMAMIGLLALATLSALPWVMHFFGAMFTLGRIAHAHGMSQKNHLGRGRSVGTLATLLSFVGMAFYSLYLIFIG